MNATAPIFEAVTEGGTRFWFTFDGAQASSAVTECWDTECSDPAESDLWRHTPYQVADSCHDVDRMAAMLNDDQDTDPVESVEEI